MTHELDFTKGQAAIAFRGQVPWHGLGETILPQDSIDDIRIKAGLDYEVRRGVVRYHVDDPFSDNHRLAEKLDSIVLYRSDTGDSLSVVSDRYQVVQPREVVGFYRDLTEKFGFELEVVGALKGGRKVWALANTNDAMNLRGDDQVKGYLLLATSYDGTMATQARFTSVRVVCNNTLTLANAEGRADVSVPHSRKFSADEVKAKLGIGETWGSFSHSATAMTQRLVNQDESVRFLLNAYYGLNTDEKIKAFQEDESKNKAGEKLMKRLTNALFNSPGAHLASAKGMLWGLLNAVTYDIDHQAPSRSSENRLDSAWFGNGAAIKQRAWERAKEMVA